MAEEKKEKEGEAAEGEAAAKPKGKKKLFIIIGVVVLLLGAGVPFFMLGGSGEEDKEDSHQEEEVHLETAELDTFIVNLSESGSFLKVKLLIEYDPAVIARQSHGEGGDGHGGGGAGGGEAEKKGIPGALGARMPMIRDSIIRVLASKTAEQVLTTEGKEQLKEELIESINEASGLDEGAVVAIYFMEFLIQ